MPAWQHRLPDADLWALVAFLQKLPAMTAPEFQRMAATSGKLQCTAPADPAPTGSAAMAGTAVDAAVGQSAVGMLSSADRGRQALTQYSCSACHKIRV